MVIKNKNLFYWGSFMGLLKRLAVSILLLVIIGCSPLTSQQKSEYDLMKNDGVLVEEKNAGAGAALGILPGFGAFYAREPVVGVVDLLLWPISILWDPVVGYEMSKKVNYDLTVSKLERDKSKELTKLENQRDLGNISKEEYVTQKRTIATKYDFRFDGV